MTSPVRPPTPRDRAWAYLAAELTPARSLARIDTVTRPRDHHRHRSAASCSPASRGQRRSAPVRTNLSRVGHATPSGGSPSFTGCPIMDVPDVLARGIQERMLSLPSLDQTMNLVLRQLASSLSLMMDEHGELALRGWKARISRGVTPQVGGLLEHIGLSDG